MMHKFTNDEISKLLRNIAVSYAIKDEKKYRFQIIAYQKASESIGSSPNQVSDIYHTGNIADFPGIGPTIKKYLDELFTTGSVAHFDEILKDIPEAIFPLLDIPSFGPKKAFRLVSHFHLTDAATVMENIYELAKQEKIAELEGFGKKSEQDIIRAIDEYKMGKTKTSRMVLPYASEIAQKMIDYLNKCKDVQVASTLGSLRRKKSTIGDVDIAVATTNPQAVLDHFVAYPHKERVIERGDITSSLLLSGGKQVDLMVLPADSLGSLLQHFTGSKDHNVALREMALKKGYSLSEKGVKLKNDGEKMMKFKSEEEFYNFLGLDWIPPEIRENTGEIELAQKQQLPQLVELKDIKGDLHIHSDYPILSSHDFGTASMEDMVKKAIKLGYDYVGFSEHNPRVNNLSKYELLELMGKRYDHIENLRKNNKSIRIFNLIECDILASGELALSDKALEYVDGLIVSIHSSFATERDKMTERILKGLSHPKARIFAHPTGRLLNKRNGYSVDWDKLFSFAAENNKALEINSWPERLDLPDDLIRDAKKADVKFVIDTDSHALTHMDNMQYGVSVARRGWCEKKDILNTQNAADFEKWLLNN